MFNPYFGTPCVRPGCGHRNPEHKEFCEKCGISLDFSRPAILDGNRWSPAPDELAAFFKFKAMRGFFTKTLHVPPGMKAWVLQGDDPKGAVVELCEGEHTTENLFQRLNNFFRSPHGEVLVSRTDALPVTWGFEDVLTAELLPVIAEVNLHLKVGDLLAFRRRFMLRDGVVTANDLREILKVSVQQVFEEWVGKRHLNEMLNEAFARDALDHALRTGLQPVLAELGLALLQVTGLALQHEAFDQQRRMKGRLWLVRRDAQLKDEHDKALNELYEERDWGEIKRTERDLRRRMAAGELQRQEADLAHTLRLLEMEQYEHILQAKTRKQAADMGAADVVDALEKQYAAKWRQRAREALGASKNAETEDDQWRHLQAIARIKRDGEFQIEKLRADEAATLERERIKNTLQRAQAQAALDAANRIDNEAWLAVCRRVALERIAKAAVREEQLEDARHKITIGEAELASQIRGREAQRIQEYEDGVLQSKLKERARESQIKAGQVSMSELSTLVAIDAQMELDALERRLKERRENQRIEDEMFDREVERHIRTGKAQMEEDLARAGAELQRSTMLGSLPLEALVVLAGDSTKIEALVKLGTLSRQSEQIRTARADTTAPLPTTPPALTVAVPSIEENVQTQVSAMQAQFQHWADRSERQQSGATVAIMHMGDNIRDVAVKMAEAMAVRQGQPAPAFAACAQPAAPVPAAHTAHVPLALKSCPHCRSINLADARLCGHCSKVQD